MVRNNTTGGVLMSKNNLSSVFILILAGMLSVPCFLAEAIAQDRIPVCPPPGKVAKLIKPLREMNWANDTITVQISFPSAFRETGRNEIIDSIALLAPVFEHLRQVRAGLSEDTVRIVHIGDSHVRGHIYPQTTGTRLTETFGAVSYIDRGVNGATCLTFTHPDRITEIAALKPELLILSFGTNESHNRRYNINVHYNQMDELVKLLRDSLPNIPILLTTPPGSYIRYRRNRSINTRTPLVAKTIVEYAWKRGYAVWDMYNIVGGRERACLNWVNGNYMVRDRVHYTAAGYTVQGNLLYEALIKAYNDYVSN